ncbi:DUF4180 domain-containing protein [Roseinatronobacter sp. S2]|uniref:DUF4180 domain-containing protein n=1 Tax=Roseinatronobacter sp. S2 TaxID=3035471 RepID=UPI00240FBF71|nr:DUF4180 domain-containing protein [Roseinatronobacter sp. S2]WFE74741.1 DUF4180 domain-containing protein [Roseinatronobacter sp. S2]
MSTDPFQGFNLYFAAAEGPALSTEQDALDLLGETWGTGADVIVVPVNRFAPCFFELSNKQAGHFFQKMQNYQARLVILGDISVHASHSKALAGFVEEINRIGHHIFAFDRKDMEVKLSRSSWSG